MLKTNRPVFHVSSVVSFSESDSLVFSGISNDLPRLVKFVTNKASAVTGNNAHVEKTEIEQWNKSYPELSELCSQLTKTIN